MSTRVTCRRCGEEKDSSEFSPSDLRRVTPYCRPCRSLFNRASKAKPGSAAWRVREEQKAVKSERKRTAPLRARVKDVIKGAKARGIVLGLGPEEISSLVLGPCEYCGAPANPVNGIDRIDSSLGYVPGNVVSCCWPCNRAKGTMSAEEYVNLCRRVAAFAKEE